MADTKKLEAKMASKAVRPKTARELLQEKMGQLVERAAEQMNDREFKKAEKKSLGVTSRVRARISQRETGWGSLPTLPV